MTLTSHMIEKGMLGGAVIHISAITFTIKVSISYNSTEGLAPLREIGVH
jgi:hypothetical protein